MKKLICLISILLILISQSDRKQGDGSPASFIMRQENPPYASTLASVQCKFYDPVAFEASFEEKVERNIEASSVIGAILPHHLVASPMIARLLTGLSDKAEKPMTLVVLAPNHLRIGDRPIHTGSLTWDTPFGALEADNEIVEELIKALDAGVNPKLLEDEHSIAALVPYLRFCFPEAKIVPVLIHGNMSPKDCSALSSFIEKQARKKRCLILASIDFSHGLTHPESKERDEITRRVIAKRDYDTLFALDNTHLDAPPTLATFLMTMDSLSDSGEADGVLVEQGEASQFLKRHVPDTTSYMTYIFR